MNEGAGGAVAFVASTAAEKIDAGLRKALGK
jgi:hypothetical protein